MVKRIKFILVVFINIIPFYFAVAQTTDSINCDNYFEWLIKRPIMVTWWASPPQLNETTNRSVLCELCDIVANDSCGRIFAALIIDEKGNPVCIRMYSEIIPDSLKNEIIKLMYKIKFVPALNGGPVSSDYTINISPQKCEFYRNIDVKYKSEKRKNKLRQSIF